MRETGTEDWREWGKTSGIKGSEVVGRHNNGVRQVCVRVPAWVCDGSTKNERFLGNKQGQRRDARAQRRDVTESINPTSRRCREAIF